MRLPRSFLGAALLGSALLLPDGLRAQVGRQRVDTAFAFDPGGSVHLSLVSGEIRVLTGTTNEIRIAAYVERGRLETSLSRSRVSIEARSVANRLGMGRFELTVPVGTRVSAGAVSGEITIRGTREEVEANTVSGDIQVEDAAKVVDIGTVSGDVELRTISGRVQVGTVSGDVHVDDITGELDVSSVSAEVDVRRGRLRVMRNESVSGNFSYEGTFTNDGTYRLNSHSGTLYLAIPANAGATLELETWSGNISSDFPLTLQPDGNMGRRQRRMEFTIGAGGARISAETFSGDITIRRLSASPRE